MLPVPSASAEGNCASSWASQCAPDALHGTGAAEIAQSSGAASRAREEAPHALPGAEAAPAGTSDGGASAPADDEPHSHYDIYFEKLHLLAPLDDGEQKKLLECFEARVDYVRAEQAELNGRAVSRSVKKSVQRTNASKARTARFNSMNRDINAGRRGATWEAAREAAEAAQRRHKKQRVEGPPGALTTAPIASCCLKAPGRLPLTATLDSCPQQPTRWMLRTRCRRQPTQSPRPRRHRSAPLPPPTSARGWARLRRRSSALPRWKGAMCPRRRG